jgi:hypothetical protein
MMNGKGDGGRERGRDREMESREYDIYPVKCTTN